MPEATTPSGVRVVAIGPDGTTDITEGVQVLYDLVIGSMDWGSGFVSVEDAVPIGELARVCGFEQVEEVDRYLRERKRENRRSQLEKQGVPFHDAIDQAMAEFPGPKDVDDD